MEFVAWMRTEEQLGKCEAVYLSVVVGVLEVLEQREILLLPLSVSFRLLQELQAQAWKEEPI
jgi:hypothetical protein